MVFTESDLNACESTYYKFGVKQLDDTGSYVPAYANTYYEMAGTLEVRHDLFPTLVPSQETTAFTTYYNADIGFQQHEYYTGNFDAHPEFKSNNALHTVAVYMTNYKGDILIEGSLDPDPTVFGDYATIQTRTYDDVTGIRYYNFNGIFSNIRVRYIPEKNPFDNQNDDPAYRGTVDKVMYRS